MSGVIVTTTERRIMKKSGFQFKDLLMISKPLLKSAQPEIFLVAKNGYKLFIYPDKRVNKSKNLYRNKLFFK